MTRFKKYYSLLLTFVGLVGCLPAAPQAVLESQPAEKQELVVAFGEDPFILELNRQRLGMYPLNASVCEPLVKLTPNFQVVPALAERWEYRGDNTFRFYLRPGVKFHDGRTLTAEAVKYTIDRTVKVRTQYSFLTEDSVRVVDDLTVDIRPSQPNARLVEQLTHPTYAIVAPGTDPATRPVCTGPFKFAEYVRQSHFTVVRFEDYWGQDKAKLQRLTFRFIPDDNTRVLALLSGEVHGIFDVSRPMVAHLKATSGVRVVTAPPGAVLVLFMNTRGSEPYTLMSDPALRRAVALAIDRRALAEKVLDGHAEVVNTVNPPVVLGRHAELVQGVPYDQVHAERLLEAAGWRLGPDRVRVKAGRRLSLSLLAQPGSIEPAIAQFIQAQLAQVGIEVRIEQLDLAAYQNRIDTGQFDLDLELPNQNDANPAFLLALRWYSRSQIRSAQFMLAGPSFDGLVDEALAALDLEVVRRKAAEAMRLLVDEEAVAVPLAGIYRIYALSDKVRGFEPHPSRTNQWWSTVWLAR